MPHGTHSLPNMVSKSHSNQLDGYRAWTMLAEAYSHLVASLVNELASQHLAQNQSMRAFAKRILG